MAEILYISQQYLKDNSIIADNADFELIKPTIVMVQDIYLQQVLGTQLYEDLRTKIGAGTLNSDEKNLIDKYLLKTLLWYIQMEVAPVLRYRYQNKGVMVKSSENSQPVSESELRTHMDWCRVKAEQYAQLTTDYLRVNSSLFPKYNDYVGYGIRRNSMDYTTGVDLGEDRYYIKAQPSWNDNGIDFGW